MEFLRGPTLAAEIQDKGGLPCRDVARIGRDLCAALEALEETGLVHCDIKPSNVIHEPGGRVVLTDFGLGWRRRVLTDSGARTGAGTPVFMAPSLLTGGTPSPRTDLYALGVTLRWALTGKAPFKSQSLGELKLEALRGPATPLAAQRPDAPPSLVAAIERAMDVSPDAPPCTAGQTRADLQAVLDESGERTDRPPGRSRSRSRGWAVVAASFVVLAGLGWGLWPLTHGGFRLGPRAPLRKAALPPKALYDGAGVISPDGSLLGFFMDGSLGVSAVESGDIRILAEAGKDGRFYRQVAWHPDGKRLLCLEADSSRNVAVSLVDIITGRHDVIARLGKLSDDAILFASVLISPNGRYLAVRKNFSAGSLLYRELWVKDLESGNERILAQGSVGDGILPPVWSPDSRRLAYVHQEATRGTRLETCSLDGQRRVAIEDPAGRLRPPWADHVSLAWLRDGRLVYGSRYEPTGSPASVELRTIRIDTKTGAASSETRLLYRHPGGGITQPSAASDGRKLAFALRQTKTRVQLLDLVSKTSRVVVPALTADEDMEWSVWSRDGRIVFLSVDRSGNHDAYEFVLASGRTTPILATNEYDAPVCLSPDGSEVLCRRGQRLVAVPTAGGPDRVLVDSLRGSVLCAVGAGRGCFLLDRTGSDVALSNLDLATGRVTERFRYALGDPDPAVRAFGAISPDGERLAVFRGNSPHGVVLDARTGRVLRKVAIRPDAIPQSASWTHEGHDLLLTGMNAYGYYWLIRLTPAGESTVLAVSEDEWMNQPSPSPDGRSIAFTGKRYSEDMWIMDDP
jgi:Tol biopolymer transport system component